VVISIIALQGGQGQRRTAKTAASKPKPCEKNVSNFSTAFEVVGKFSINAKRAYDFTRKPLNFLVAGRGFEPLTFGL